MNSLAGLSGGESARRWQLRPQKVLQMKLQMRLLMSLSQSVRDRREQLEFMGFHLYSFNLVVKKCWRFIPITSIYRQLSMNSLHLLLSE